MSLRQMLWITLFALVFLFQEARISVLQSKVDALEKAVLLLASDSAVNSDSIKKVGDAVIDNSEAIKLIIGTMSDPRNRLAVFPK